MPEKLKMHSPDLVQSNIDRIAELFPNCVTEAAGLGGQITRKIDFDLLRQELSDEIVEGPLERYHLNWPGKREAMLAANAPIAKTLRPCREESVDFDNTKNLFIEGDNLEALKLLQETYLGKVKVIYIDPPYNTGREFIYDDNFGINAEDYFVRSGQNNEESGQLVINTESDGRFHSNWLSMILPRLKLARNMLRADGFIVVSIDDAELESMKKLLNEVFGKDNELATLVWDRNRKNDARYFSIGHEYMCVYARSQQQLADMQIQLREPKVGVKEARRLFDSLVRKNGIDWQASQIEWRQFYNGISPSDERKKIGRYAKVDENGPYRDDGNISWPGGGGPRYEVLHPVSNLPCKIPSRGWVFPDPKRFWEEVSAGRVVFGADETTTPRIRSNLFDSDGQVMQSVFYSYAQTAAVEFSNLMGGKVFDNPKNWKDLARVIGYLTTHDDIVMDFFAGSGSTAHAVLSVNVEQSRELRYILVQVAESCVEHKVAFKNGYTTIAELARDRIVRAAKALIPKTDLLSFDIDLGFRVLKIDSSNMKDVYYSPQDTSQALLGGLVDNIKPDRSGEDLLFQVLLDCGVDLGLPIRSEAIDHCQAFFVNDSEHAPPDLVACFDADVSESLIKTIATKKPIRAVFRDHCFATDADKINVEQIFKQMSPGTQLKSL